MTVSAPAYFRAMRRVSRGSKPMRLMSFSSNTAFTSAGSFFSSPRAYRALSSRERMPPYSPSSMTTASVSSAK